MSTPESSKLAGSSMNKALRRAALVLVSLEDSEASELLSQMSAEQVEAITQAVENLNEIDPQEQQEALREFRLSLHQDSANVKPAESVSRLNDDPTRWPAGDIQASFDLGLVDFWALALADCDLETVQQVHKSLMKVDRKRLQVADRNRGPWRLDEPQKARESINRQYRKYLSGSLLED